MKYKVGDKVKVISKETNANEAVIGDVGKIIAIDEVSLPYLVEFDNERSCYHNGNGIHGHKGKKNHCYWCSERMLELISVDQKIVITVDGSTTLARLYEGKKVVKTAEAKCAPDDKFDFNIGAKLAFERLTTNEPSYYNGKIICTKCKEDFVYTVGKIYEVKDGQIVIDNGNTIPTKPAKSIEDLKKLLLCEFIEVKE